MRSSYCEEEVVRPDKGQRSREEEEVSQSVYEGGKQQHSTAHCASESPDSKGRDQE